MAKWDPSAVVANIIVMPFDGDTRILVTHGNAVAYLNHRGLESAYHADAVKMVIDDFLRDRKCNDSYLSAPLRLVNESHYDLTDIIDMFQIHLDYTRNQGKIPNPKSTGSRAVENIFEKRIAIRKLHKMIKTRNEASASYMEAAA